MQVIALLYELGEGVPTNFDESYKWYSILSDLNPDNDFFLYKKGFLRVHGKVDDQIDLVNIFNKLSKNKPTKELDENYFVEAQFYLGQIYRYGIFNTN